MSGTDEQWKPLDDDETLGMVSNQGNVKSVHGVVLKQKTTNKGYKSVNIRQRGKGISKHYLVHRLVAKAFCEGFKVGLTVNHKDGDKFNNIAYNLEWVTQKQNVHHSFRTGLRKLIGKKPTIPHEDRDLIMLKRSNGATVQSLAEQYGVHRSSMSNYINGRKRKAYSFEMSL